MLAMQVAKTYRKVLRQLALCRDEELPTADHALPQGSGKGPPTVHVFLRCLSEPRYS